MPSFRAFSPSLRPITRPKFADLDAESIHVPVARAIVDCGVYVEGMRLPGKYTHAGALAKVRECEQEGKKAFVWVGLHEPDQHQLQAVAEVFGLPPLAVGDALRAHQRPTLQRYDKTLFLVLKTVKYVAHESMAKTREIVETGEIMVFVSPDSVVTVRHGEHGKLATVRAQLDGSPALLELGSHAVMHAIADHVVDSYFDVADLIEKDIDEIQEEVFSPGSRPDIECIYLLKREVVELNRAVSPLTAALQRMSTDDNDLISVEVRRYMRDVLDHNILAADRITSYDAMLGSLVHAALGKVAMQQNIDMRKISAWVAIAAVPTMVAGIYGMNFEHMPELQSPYGYPAVLALMLVVCLFLYRTFRRNDWL